MTCVCCSVKILPAEKFNYDWIYDDEGEIWCMPCAETEGDTGEI